MPRNRPQGYRKSRKPMRPQVRKKGGKKTARRYWPVGTVI